MCRSSIVRSGDAIYVRVGDHDLTRKYGSPGAQTLRVATTYIHHNHNSQTLDNDVALLKLHGQAELAHGVCLVCLPARGAGHPPGKRCTVTGYGYMGEGEATFLAQNQPGIMKSCLWPNTYMNFRNINIYNLFSSTTIIKYSDKFRSVMNKITH